ncbi:orotidine-5'-phosphate decarboxylase [Candidatus Parcubacteria bacterium]|nr:orotidine-5'-phosphate decarboxylase [Candidatus Parcubacteria bacterium]
MLDQPKERDLLQLLDARWGERKYVCVGLDPVYERIPLSVPGRHEGSDVDRLEKAVAFYNFCVMQVNATADIAAAYKPNTAFFEAAGGWGYELLGLLIRHIRREAPGVPIIVDAKRADIGKTNVGTAELIFDIYEADALTVNPYFGEEALRPFLSRPHKGVVVLCRTSNPGAGEFQNMLVRPSFEQLSALGLLDSEWESIPLYQWVAMQVRQWQTEGSCAVVVGATAPEELYETRLILPWATILIPGVGAQQGDLGKSVLNGMSAAQKAFLINAGSKELYASAGADFAQVTRAGVKTLNTSIGEILDAA